MAKHSLGGNPRAYGSGGPPHPERKTVRILNQGGGRGGGWCLEMPMFGQGIPVCRKVYMSYLAGARPLFSLNAFQ